MKKSLIVLLLAVGVAAQAQTAPAGQPQSAPGAAASQQQKKVIQDPGEYNAYLAAVKSAEPAEKAQMMESYLQTYPNSVVKEEGLEVLLTTYSQLGKVEQMKATAQRLLQVDPKNLTALVVLTSLDHQAVGSTPNAAAVLKEAGEFGARCLDALGTAPMPDGSTAEQWEATKTSFRGICASAVGHAALQAGDYAAAQQNLKVAVAAQPADIATIYQLALAYLTPKPPMPDGLFWIARAQALSPNPQLLAYAKNRYERYHGGTDGFDELLVTAKASATIPAGFTVAPAPSPAEQAADMLKKSTPEKLSFAEWQFILTSGNKEASEQVWTAIKGKPVQLVAAVIDATRDSLKLAGSADDIDAKKADITLTLREPLALARLPKAGTQLVIQGNPSEYSAQGDSFNMTFGSGDVLKGLPEPPKKPSPVHKAH